MSLIFLFFLLFVKVLGIYFSYQAHLPDRFPPETFVSIFGYRVYLFIFQAFYYLNEKIRLFPSVLVTLMGKTSVKIFFFKLPWLSIDLVILLLAVTLFLSANTTGHFCPWMKRTKSNLPKAEPEDTTSHKVGRGSSFTKKKKSWLLFLFLNLNCWFFYYFDAQRISFKEKIYFYILKPYKLSPLDARVITCALVIVVISFALMVLKKTGHLWLKNLAKKVFFKKLVIVFFVFGIFFVINSLGIFIHFSPVDNVEWKSYWISPKGDIEKENLYFIFEKKFNLLFKPEKAEIFSFCQSDYRLFVNGFLVGQGGLISGDSMTYYDYWQADKFLKKGENIILIECYNPYLDTLSLVKKKTGMIFQLEAQKSWLRKRIISDGSWKVAIDRRYKEKTEFVSKTSGFQEFFDVTVPSPLFEKVLVVDHPPITPWNELIMRPIPYLERKSVKPLKIMTIGQFVKNPLFDSPDLAVVLGNGFKERTEVPKFKELPVKLEKKDTFLVFDFGKIIVGYPKITLSGNGGTVSFGFAETFKNDGSLDIAKMVSQADQIKFGHGEFSYLWHQRRAFRYVMVVFDIDKSIDFKNFRVETVNYPANEEESYFNSSDPLLNKIFTVSKYTAKIARQGNFEDCPHREKAQYVGDMRIVSLVNYYNFSDKELIKKALWEFALSQQDDGFVRAVYPAGRKLLIPDYSAQWVTSVWEYYLYSGDRNFLEKIYSSVKRQIEGFVRYSGPDYLVRSQQNWWIFIDQGGQTMNIDKSIPFNIFYLEALKSASNISRELGEKDDEERFQFLARQIGEIINEKSWNRNYGLYDDCLIGDTFCNHFSRQTNYLALLMGIVPPEKIRTLAEKLVYNSDLPVIITPYFNSWVAEALFQNKMGEEALNLIREYWGGMLRNNATTFWETFDPRTGKENAAFGESLSHGWSSGPAYLLPKWILGIEPLEPAYLSFRVKPIFADLNFASGKIPIDEGKSIEVSWYKGSGLEIRLKYNFPAKAELSLPFYEGKKIYLNGSEIKDLQYEGTIVKFFIGEPGEYKIIVK